MNGRTDIHCTYGRTFVSPDKWADVLGCVSMYANYLSDGLCPYGLKSYG